jgi:hypothetical protein
VPLSGDIELKSDNAESRSESQMNRMTDYESAVHRRNRLEDMEQAESQWSVCDWTEVCNVPGK